MPDGRELLSAGGGWASERLIFSGDDFFDQAFAEAAQAKSTLEVETYIFEQDPIGRRAEDALARAARGGARVRLLVDGIGARAWLGRRSRSFAESGVEVRVYHPLWPFAVRPPRGSSRARAGFLRLINRRNHRKTWIIDGRAAYVGSMNVSANHSARVLGARAWQDAAVRVEGDEISLLRAAFDHAWARARTLDGKNKWIERLKVAVPKTESLVRLNFTKKLRKRSHQDFLGRVESAKSRVWIANPYLVPSPGFLRALKKARKAGADVKILAPRVSDVFFMRWIATAYYGPLSRAGAEIYEYEPRFLHQKSAIVDGWAAVGTSNLNTRSLLRDLEVDVVLARAENVARLAQEYEALLRDSSRVRPTWRRWSLGFLGRAAAFLFRNWI